MRVDEKKDAGARRGRAGGDEQRQNRRALTHVGTSKADRLRERSVSRGWRRGYVSARDKAACSRVELVGIIIACFEGCGNSHLVPRNNAHPPPT